MKFLKAVLQVFVQIAIVAVVAIIVSSYVIKLHEEQCANNQGSSGHLVVKPIEIPSQITFMGERVPVENFDTRESLDRELQVNMFWHSQTIMLLKRANRYFPEIEPILKENNVPDDLKYIALIESGLMNVTSPSGAKGFWQFLEGTAKECLLEVNNEVDERYNVAKATQAAIRYFKKQNDRFGSWTMAAASYNMGGNGLAKQVARQKCNNYYDLTLGEETERYVFRALAIKMIFENPTQFGFNIPTEFLYEPIPCRIVEVDSTISNIADFAFSQGTNYKMLKVLNPWLRDNKLTNRKGKTYQIKIIDSAYRNVVIDTLPVADSTAQPIDAELK
ncbi:MAG: lytic transglycosylase domain-containing protein [Salinivirgaceae bacterium]|nr:lytic transglycosylase domain-containing protein [Salinivirgaceae bacterium]